MAEHLWTQPGRPAGEYGAPDADFPYVSIEVGPSDRVANGLLLLALNPGIDPPDAARPERHSVLEAWVDPTRQPPAESFEMITHSLEAQFREAQPNESVTFTPVQYPYLEKVRSDLHQHRQTAHDHKALLYYNGHGVPRPTDIGDIWLFNKEYNEYHPLDAQSLAALFGPPSLLIFDCSYAEKPLNCYLEACRRSAQRGIEPDVTFFGACGENELLPTNPGYPADVFTSCMTKPVKTALLHFVNHSTLHKVSPKIIERIPGPLSDKSTPLGELNWIFITITETIAYNILPPDVYQRFFRQDSLVNFLFRGFLLADRVMRTLGCTPVCYPPIPAAYNHPLWETWDMAVDNCLFQCEKASKGIVYYTPSNFFSNQLTALEIWLDLALQNSEFHDPPPELPVINQALLGKPNRQRVLNLLCRIMDLGAWTVAQTRTIGTYFFVLRLLLVNDAALNDSLVFIWGKILAFDKNFSADFIRNKQYRFFLAAMANDRSNKPWVRPMATFCIAELISRFKHIREACMQNNILAICARLTEDPDPLVRKWGILLISKIIEGFDLVKTNAAMDVVSGYLNNCLHDKCPDVRAAAVYTLSLTIAKKSDPSVALDSSAFERECTVALAIMTVILDASHIVRREVVYGLSRFFSAHWREFKSNFFGKVSIPAPKPRMPATEITHGSMGTLPAIPTTPKKESSRYSPGRDPSPVCDMTVPDDSSIYGTIWNGLVALTKDSHPSVYSMAQELLERIRNYSEDGNDAPEVASNVSSRPRSTGSLPCPGTGRMPFGLMSNLKPVMMDSVYYEWCASYWREPTLRTEDPTSPEYMMKQQKALQEKKFLEVYRAKWDKVSDCSQVEAAELYCQSEDMIGLVAKSVIFHPFENYFVCHNGQNTVGVVSMEKNAASTKFNNFDGRDASISSMFLLNESSNTHLAVGSREGTVRIWRDIQSPTPQLVSSFCALQNIVVNKAGKGMLLHYNKKERLIACGDSQELRCWDISTELETHRLKTDVDFGVTSISGSSDNPNLFACGFDNGAVRLFDLRNGECVTSFPPDPSETLFPNRVLDISMLGSNQVLASSYGTMKMLDLSGRSVVYTLHEDQLNICQAHPNANLVAIGSHKPVFKILNRSGECLTTIRYHTAYFGHKVTSARDMAFHPYDLTLAITHEDRWVSIFSIRKKQK